MRGLAEGGTMKLWLFLIVFGVLLVYAGSQRAKMLFGVL
jgi:hypothetical protein